MLVLEVKHEDVFSFLLVRLLMRCKNFTNYYYSNLLASSLPYSHLWLVEMAVMLKVIPDFVSFDSILPENSHLVAFMYKSC